jgi:tRNA (cmo5U34)-methyltransferase
LFEGYIEDAPLAPYDAATAILTFHFIAEQQRLETLMQIRKRLKTDAPFIAVHLSFPQSEPERSKWIARHVAYGLANVADPTKVESARQAIGTRLSILSPDDEVAMMQEAGFSNVSLFYAGLSIKGWLAYAA